MIWRGIIRGAAIRNLCGDGQLLDAKPVPLPFKGDGGFRKGAIDCAENNMPSLRSHRPLQAGQERVCDQPCGLAEALVVSAALWGKLTEADRKVFQDAGVRSALLMRELWNKRVAQAQRLRPSRVRFVRVRTFALCTPHVAAVRQVHERPTTREELLSIIADK